MVFCGRKKKCNSQKYQEQMKEISFTRPSKFKGFSSNSDLKFLHTLRLLSDFPVSIINSHCCPYTVRYYKGLCVIYEETNTITYFLALKPSEVSCA